MTIPLHIAQGRFKAISLCNHLEQLINAEGHSFNCRASDTRNFINFFGRVEQLSVFTSLLQCWCWSHNTNTVHYQTQIFVLIVPHNLLHSHFVNKMLAYTSKNWSTILLQKWRLEISQPVFFSILWLLPTLHETYSAFIAIFYALQVIASNQLLSCVFWFD